ncbi:DUF1688 family protein [Schizosaccharomyces cryophilus OY26]|uniref:DUF1688 family protein n=1 Tax=Schizosaccharomyces cryophilus (strain OY26 / ATCC MYA-4695 / CBS 11777 / NBRC 106824 / NRRL Y48691) TaxID=653667 RepID=S9W133_SCHCR|nr:DUF1688 family protein [Schizosaccharomyces cryophilus OY26]EPY52184.1 DUF1688 family protein [Schizosaccharomyces cryophilus OY26]
MTTDTIADVLSLQNIRIKAQRVFAVAEQNRLRAFEYDPCKLDTVADFVVSVIQADFKGKYETIPPHGRWQHFEVGNVARLTQLISTWNQQGVTSVEVCKRVLDITFLSVLLDAGAGDKWSYLDGVERYARSEGLAVASLRCFQKGLFSSNPENPYQVDGVALSHLKTEALADGFQVSKQNPIAGIEGRASILRALGNQLKSSRPSFFVDSVFPTGDFTSESLNVERLWSELQTVLIPIWPERTKYAGENVGDAWFLPTINSIQPFHKLTQWLTYSLLIPLKRLLHIQVVNETLLTGLPEYRNGGLFVDFGVLKLRPEYSLTDEYEPESIVIVEWRAMTVVLLDKLLNMINERMKNELSAPLSLAQMLEAGSWKSGRIIARKLRPANAGSPILIKSDDYQEWLISIFHRFI